VCPVRRAWARELPAQPKARGRRAAAPPLRELGEDPSSSRPIVIKEGRYGPYVTDGETNASLRRGDDVDSITVQRAIELLAERRAAEPSAPPPRGRRAGMRAGPPRRGARVIPPVAARRQRGRAKASRRLARRAHPGAVTAISEYPISR